MVPILDFWYEFASTYSYPAAMTIADRAKAAGVDLRWNPFLLGPLFRDQQGLADSPFNSHAEKGRYMWRDMERNCAALGLPFRRPSVFPRKTVLAARAALAAGPDIAAVSRKIFAANFADDRDIADPALLAELLGEAGAAILERAGHETIRTALRRQTEHAGRLGLFGSPSFTTQDGELFWGNDRIDQALAWAVSAAQKAPA